MMKTAIPILCLTVFFNQSLKASPILIAAIIAAQRSSQQQHLRHSTQRPTGVQKLHPQQRLLHTRHDRNKDSANKAIQEYLTEVQDLFRDKPSWITPNNLKLIKKQKEHTCDEKQQNLRHLVRKSSRCLKQQLFTKRTASSSCKQQTPSTPEQYSDDEITRVVTNFVQSYETIFKKFETMVINNPNLSPFLSDQDKDFMKKHNKYVLDLSRHLRKILEYDKLLNSSGD